MSLDLAPDERPLRSIDELVEFFRGAERPASEHQVGLEHEKFLFLEKAIDPVPYEGPRGVGALLAALAPGGYEPFREAKDLPIIALQHQTSTISLEPGGQFELSGSPARTARAVHAENVRHLREVKAAAKKLGIQLVALGYRPFGRPAQMPWMPKSRYAAMRKTLGARGKLAFDMMLMTATGQVSLDWSSEADCARKVTVSSRIAPLVVALFANSPIVDGKPSGLLSYRSHVWTDVDPARCGFFPAMLDGSFSYRAYVEWALDAPLLFLRRHGDYLTPPLTFRQLMKEGFEGKPAVHADWTDHLSTLFPEVRIKRVMEIRSADCVSSQMTGGLAALMRGLLYSPEALDEAERLMPKPSLKEQLALMEAARREGLRAKHQRTTLGALAQELVAISRRGLERIDPEDVPILEPLAEVARSGRSPADRVLERFAEASPADFVASFAL